MNAIQLLASEPWVERLGWTLLHFLWQGLAIAILYAAARHRTTAPRARYLLACAALAAMIAAPPATWTAMRPPETIPDPAYRIRTMVPPPSAARPAPIAMLPEAVRDSVSPVQPARFLPWVVMVWLLGAAAFWVRLAGGWVVAARMRSLLVRRAPPEWQSMLAELAARMRVSRPVHLLVSALVQAPTVVGWLRPVVLVPVGALGGLPAEHLEALLLHELAHIRRHDYLVNVLQSIAESMLFYHPAVWWVSGHIRAERELCCDDLAVSVNGDALTYACALAQLESYRPAHSSAVAASGGSLSSRISRLLGEPRPAAGMGPGVFAVALLLVLAAYGVFAQSAARPAFQVASVKPHPAAERRAMIVRAQPGGRLTTQDAPLALLMQNAYRVQSFQIVGGPAWINSDGFDIEAKPEGSTDERQMWLMLQTLLADRFQLAVHRETREFPVWALTAANGGPKLPPPKGGGCISSDPAAPAPPAPARGSLPNIPCGVIRVGRSPAGLRRLEGQLVPMAELVRILAMVMGRPVLNRTGFTSDLDVQVDFTPDESTMGLAGMGGPRDPGGIAAPPMDSSQPNIFAALQQDLGLKLAPAKGPVEVLVIDRVERPTAN